MLLYLLRTDANMWTTTTEEWAERTIRISSIEEVPRDVFMGQEIWKLLEEGLKKGLSAIPSKYDDIDF